MASIIPTSMDYSKEGVQCYIDGTTIDFTEPNGSSIYAYITQLASMYGIDGKTVDDMYRRSVIFSKKFENTWTKEKLLFRIGPMVNDVIKIVGFDKKGEAIEKSNQLVDWVEENFGSIEDLIDKDSANMLIYVYNRLKISQIKKFLKEVRKIDLDFKEEDIDKIYNNISKAVKDCFEDIIPDTNKPVPFEFVEPKYNLVTANIIRIELVQILDKFDI